ncbi:MAG: hypothetical protein V5A36_08300 [Natronomonas sp.]
MTNTTTPETEQRYLRIDYVARTGDGRIIDTTDPDVAAESDLADLEASGPVVVVPGEGHLFEPLEEAIRDAEPGETIEMAVGPEDAFGTADPGKMATLDEEAVAPEHRNAGSTVQLGGRRAVVEEVSDGTVTVDFNHPLAGLTLEYEIEVLERLEGIEDRAAGLATTHGIGDASIDYDAESGELTLRLSASEPKSDRDACKRAYIQDVYRLLDIETVTTIERYN